MFSHVVELMNLRFFSNLSRVDNCWNSAKTNVAVLVSFFLVSVEFE